MLSFRLIIWSLAVNRAETRKGSWPQSTISLILSMAIDWSQRDSKVYAFFFFFFFWSRQRKMLRVATNIFYFIVTNWTCIWCLCVLYSHATRTCYTHIESGTSLHSPSFGKLIFLVVSSTNFGSCFMIESLSIHFGTLFNTKEGEGESAWVERCIYHHANLYLNWKTHIPPS